MSQIGNTVVADIQAVAAAFGKIIPVVETVGAVLVPGAGPALATAISIAKGVVAGVPEALDLYEQFQSDTPPTQEQLDAYAAGEDAAYEKLIADISARQTQT